MERAQRGVDELRAGQKVLQEAAASTAPTLQRLLAQARQPRKAPAPLEQAASPQGPPASAEPPHKRRTQPRASAGMAGANLGEQLNAAGGSPAAAMDVDKENAAGNNQESATAAGEAEPSS